MGAAADHKPNEEIETNQNDINDITYPSSSDAQINNPNEISIVMDLKNTNQEDLPKLIWIDERVNLEENNFYKSYILKNHNKYEIFSFESVNDSIKNLR